jgi:hypothetical protein
VISGLTDHSGFFKTPEPAVSVLTGLKADYDAALLKAANRGKVEIAARNAAAEAFIAALDEEASYVDMACKGDLTRLLESGYEPVSTNRTRVALDKVQVLKVAPAMSGQLKVRVKAQSSAKAYEGRIKQVGGEFGPSITFASSRDILFAGLTAGVKYVIQVCAIGGLTGRSDWSDPVESMAM